MSDDQAWNDEAQNDLREALRWVVRGEIRLNRQGRKEVVDMCRDVYIIDDCPEPDQKIFVDFAADEYDRAYEQFQLDQSDWPEKTDCDRLDNVEKTLRNNGILLWQVSPCCDTCTGAELSDRIELIDRQNPGFRERVRGYAFFIDQTLPESLSEGTQLSIYLAYGWLSTDKAEIDPSEDRKRALGIAQEVCECLRNEGLQVDWDGDYSRKIGVSLNWLRRDMLT